MLIMIAVPPPRIVILVFAEKRIIYVTVAARRVLKELVLVGNSNPAAAEGVLAIVVVEALDKIAPVTIVEGMVLLNSLQNKLQ
jgi:sirohydrochlorin ferrochelatase